MATATLDLRQVAGRFILYGSSQDGRFTYFVGETLRALPEVRIWWPRFIEEAWNIGVGSMFLVLLISIFAGAVTALMAGYQFTGSLPY
jgi:ABC-type transporter Mla maintaining outer membrane lipid asymmetry permease subunit MlaE